MSLLIVLEAVTFSFSGCGEVPSFFITNDTKYYDFAIIDHKNINTLNS